MFGPDRDAEKLFGCLCLTAFTLAPFGLWKLGEIVAYFCIHIRWVP